MPGFHVLMRWGRVKTLKMGKPRKDQCPYRPRSALRASSLRLTPVEVESLFGSVYRSERRAPVFDHGLPGSEDQCIVDGIQHFFFPNSCYPIRGRHIDRDVENLLTLTGGGDHLGQICDRFFGV